MTQVNETVQVVEEAPVTRLINDMVHRGCEYDAPFYYGPRILGANEKAVRVGLTVYPTLTHSNGVRIGLSGETLYVAKNQVYRADSAFSDPDTVQIAAIICPRELRGCGRASKALDLLQHSALQLGLRLQLEAIPLKAYCGGQKTGLSCQQLLAWYERHGWCATDEGKKILEFNSERAIRGKKLLS